MSKAKWWVKVLNIIGIVLMGLTAVATVMAGIGTTCVALAAENYSSKMALIAPYKWVYVLFVLITTAVGVMGVRATIMLIKRKPGAYSFSLITLMAGIVINVIHVVVSRAIRGSSMPTDGIVYITVFTLIIFFIFRIPGIWKEYSRQETDHEDDGRLAAAFTLVACGVSVLIAPEWFAVSHTFEPGGFNWANAWPLQMSLTGILLVLGGLSLAVLPYLRTQQPKPFTIKR
ncbi:MAG: hypothetical protein CL609_00460 [Anaerolineaceae bacterium]|nr:hypothetical protein [Anaerolineaceae bacterium]